MMDQCFEETATRWRIEWDEWKDGIHLRVNRIKAK